MGKKHDAHHGGAWKVAYADFVTAMMALFMVLWISAQDKEILIATSKYFQNPFDSPMEQSVGVLPDGAGPGSGQSESEDTESSLTEISLLNKLAKDFYRMLSIDDVQTDTPIDISVTNDGIRVTVYDRHDRPLFKPGTVDFTEWGDFVVQNLAWVLDQHKFKVRIDGHVAAGQRPRDENYTAWEFSSDRAHAMRRALQHYAIAENRFERVTGFADTVPVPGKAPDAESNQRIELSLVLVTPLPPTK